MYAHFPDRWAIAKVTTAECITYHILASFYGGYLGGDSWRLSTTITKFERATPHTYKVETISGSEYILHVDQEGYSSYAYNNYKYYEKQSSDEIKLELISFKESPYVGT